MLFQLFASVIPVVALFAVVLTIVLRAGASRVFFDVVGSFQAGRLIADTEAHMAVVQGLMLDGMSGIFESSQLIAEQIDQVTESTVSMAKQIGEARIEYEKFASFVGAGDVAQEIIQQGEALAFGADQALKAGAKMAQLSNILGSGEAISAATTAGMEFGLIGGMQTEDAMKKMIALHQQTGFMYGDLTKAQYDMMSAENQANTIRANTARIMDELNTIENRSAATMSQIIFVMNQFAATAVLAGDDIAYMAAMSATLIEAGEEQGRAGRALKMMYARLAADTANNNDVLEHYGVTVKDASGNMRSMKEIMTDLAAVYPHLEQGQKEQIAQAIAGKDHMVRALKLMEQHNRTIELEVQGLSRLDSAQEEVNRKMEDNVTILKAQEEALNNAKGALGDQLLPAMIRSTRAQTNLTEGFVLLSENMYGFQEAMGAVVNIREYFGLFAPIMEANLNIMSLNVSLQTQRQIMRAIGNEELVNASAYGGRIANQAMSLSMLREEAGIRHQLAQQEILNLRIGHEKLNIQQVLASDRRILNIAEEHSNRTKIAQLEKQFQLESNAAKQAQLFAQGLNETERQQKEIKRQQLQTDRESLDAAKADLQMLQMATEKEKMRAYITNHNLYQRTSAEKRIEQGLANQGSVRKANLYVEETEAIIKAKILELEQNIRAVESSPDGLLIKHMDLEASKNILQALKNEHTMLENKQRASLKAVLLKHQELDATFDMTKAEIILNAAQQKGIDIIGNKKINTYTKGKQITDAYKVATLQLAQSYNVNEQELGALIMKLPIYQQQLGMVEIQSEKTAMAKQRLNNVTMVATGAFGALSMIMGIFAKDNEYLQQVMAMLLTLSMVPMTLQMFTMTTATMQAAAGMYAYSAGVTTAGNATKAAMSSTGVGIALVVIGTLASFLLPLLFDNSNLAAEGMEDLGISTSYTADEFERYAQSVEDFDLDMMYENVLSNQRNLNEELENAEKIQDSTTKALSTQRIATLEKELAISTDIHNMRLATAVLDGEISKTQMENIFDHAQAIDDLEERQREIEEGKGIFKKKRIKNKQEEIDDILGLIPDEYEGAILDLMKTSETYDEFLVQLEKFAEETEGGLAALGLSFDTFGADTEENFVGAIERAKDAMFDFNNEREELFFGMSKGNITGDMVKQVVNKGVETLINTTEVIMTNTFNGMTTRQASDEIIEQVMEGLYSRGVSIQR